MRPVRSLVVGSNKAVMVFELGRAVRGASPAVVEMGQLDRTPPSRVPEKPFASNSMKAFGAFWR